MKEKMGCGEGSDVKGDGRGEESGGDKSGRVQFSFLYKDGRHDEGVWYLSFPSTEGIISSRSPFSCVW